MITTRTAVAVRVFVVTCLLGMGSLLTVPTTAHAQMYYSFPLSGGNNTENLLPKCTLGANPVLVNSSPYSTTLSWTTENASYVTITDVGTVAATGQYTIPAVYGTRTFVLNATNAYGTRSCDVVVYGQAPNYGSYGTAIPVYNESTGLTGTAQNPGCYISVTPAAGASSNAYVLNWVGAGALSATISNVGNVATSGSQAVTVSGTTVYTLTVFGLNGVSRTCSTTAYVAGSYDPYAAYAYPYGSYGYRNYSDVQYPYGYTRSGAYGRGAVVPLSRVPYTGPIEDVVSGVFSLATLVTSVYGMRRILG